MVSTQTTCPYCGVGCGVVAAPQTDGSVLISGDTTHPANFGRLCSKGSALGETLALDNRLLAPKVAGQTVDWDTALDKVAIEFSRIIEEHGPDAVAMYVSGQILTEDYYVANKFMKGFVGTGNIDTNSRLCMSSAVAAHKRAFGSDTVPGNYEDLEQCDLLILTGSNLAWCHPVLFQRISAAKEARPEMKIVVIDPRKTATCDMADLHLSLKPGSDAFLFNGLLHYLKDSDALDWEYIEAHVEGFAATLNMAKKTAGSVPKTAASCELAESDVADFFRLFATTDKVVTVFSQGVNQSATGTDKCNAIINCHLATGRIAQPGMGPFSITGQPNAMGGRETGGLANQLAAHMEITNPSHHDKVSRFWQTNRLTQTAGAKAVDMFADIASGKIKAIWIIATNPVVSLPDASAVKRALQQCEFVVVSDCEAQTDCTEFADVLLPALAWGEKDGTVTNSERRISRQKSFLSAPGGARADWQIIADVACRMGHETAFSFDSAYEVFREHAALSGFENAGSRDFDISGLSAIAKSDYDALSPIQWPVTGDNKVGTARMFSDHHFYTDSGKARMLPITPELPQLLDPENFPLILNTGRVRDQWHTMTRTGRVARLGTHTPEPVIEMHPRDAARWQCADKSLAVLESPHGQFIGRVQCNEGQQPGSVFVPIHWNGQYAADAVVAALVPAITDPLSGQPQAKQAAVSIRDFKAKWHGFILSRQPIALPVTSYWVKVKGQQFWRYELAGEQSLLQPGHWAQKVIGEEGEWLEFTDSRAGRFRAAKIINDQLQAVVFIGPDHHLPDRQWLSQLFTSETLDTRQRQSLLMGKAPGVQEDAGAMVCACFGVAEQRICNTIREQRLQTVEQITAACQAGGNCGSCIPELRQILARTKLDGAH
ncbi:Assimilatory nitrate reductase large subunit [Methylophaga frappieri]|uniref:Assimilatory nitrate reductase large subunit n=1 Tax=Methylophaga frappieri (strain ATCC BAA-2434 / DSM 25690 / JAM7) TaxID=754477 RepID=I1YH29_METFJ|nr:nitrate reductase [Methylophaga frappieri]AFJ02222.1 Assimilatory nitrate reductase large subunit [Methylophaga frappieri]